MSEYGYPEARRLDLTEDLLGYQVSDPYRWLEDAGSAERASWLAAQADLFAAQRAELPGREAFTGHVRDLLNVGYTGTPVWRGERYFFTRRDPDAEHGVLCTRLGDGPVEVLVDPMAIDPSGLTTLDAWQPDKEGRLLAYQLSEGGDEESLLRVMDVGTGALADGPIDRCRYSNVAWLPGGKAFYYTRRLPPALVPDDESQYHRRVYLHQLGTPADEDVLIFGEGRDKTDYYSVSVSRDGRWLAITASRGTAPRNDLWLADLSESDPAAHALSEITVHDLATGEQVGQVPLPGAGTAGGTSERPEGGHEAWFVYTDYTTSSVVLRFDARDSTVSTWATAPGSAEVPAVSTRQVTYQSKDGTLVRMLVISGEQAPEGPRPAILYGYGGFDISLTPAYSPNVLAWVAAGGVYAVANLRGGSEEGEEWHRAGMLEHKGRVFEDFHAAAETLIRDGWTTPDQLAIWGGSNGGLLVGAALTQRPELYAAVICSAPLLDMVRYELFGLGQTWNVEYGSASDPEQLGWLLSYSPYHHVVDGTAYPAVLFTVFTSDTRVDPVHAYKMCAALQDATSSGRPVLLRAEGQVGHGARAVSRSAELAGDTLAFAARYTGLRLG